MAKFALGSILLNLAIGKVVVHAFVSHTVTSTCHQRSAYSLKPRPRQDSFPGLENIGNQKSLSSLVSSFQNDDRSNRTFRIQESLRNAIAKVSATDEVSKWRAAATVFLSSIVMFRPFLDHQLANLWSYLTTSPSFIAAAFRHDHWEWVLAVVAFSVYIHWYCWADHAVLKAGKEGRVHPWRKFRLQDRLEAQEHRRSLLVQKEKGQVVDLSEQPPLVTPQSPWNWKGYVFELWVYVVPLFVLDRLFPRRALRLPAFGPPTAFTICRDVTCGLLLYDFFFFCGHLLMHKLPLLWGVHRKHHEVKEVRAGDVVRLSLVEEVLEVFMSVVALTVLKAHPVSRSIYNCIIIFLLTELHCGFDFPWSPQNVVPFGLATGSRRHHFHHRHGIHYYQKFFHTFDRLFGFFQPNDGSLRGDSVQSVKNLPSSWTASS